MNRIYNALKTNRVARAMRFRRFRREDVERMRQEMWSQFAPDTTMPTEPRRPGKRSTLTDEDYGSSPTDKKGNEDAATSA